MTTTHDYLIIGQGIAGSTLAFRMMEAGLRVMVMDRPAADTGSRVAAGVVNPVTGRQLVKSWKIDELLVEVEALYRRMEQALGLDLLRAMPIYKLFGNAKDRNDWEARQGREGYGAYLSDPWQPSWPGVPAPFGAGTIRRGFWLDIRTLIDGMQAWLDSRGAYRSGRFDGDMLERPGSGPLRYGDLVFRKLIFCEGWLGAQNPFFGHLPLNSAKGEIITVHCPGLEGLDGILNRHGFVIPLGHGQFKVGATFIHGANDGAPTEAGRTELIGKFQRFCTLPFSVTGHEAAFRPTVRDRRPLIGPARADGRIYNFNGLGTKGVSLAAWFSGHLLEHLEGGTALEAEADLRRFEI